MIFSDSTSSQSAHRQRRLASEEKVRVDRVLNEAAVREGVERQAGEAPSRVEVDRFRSLMQARAEEASSTLAKVPVDEASERGGASVAGDFAGTGADRLAQTIGERFRALFDAPVGAAGDERGDGSVGDAPRDAETAGGSTARSSADGPVAADAHAPDRGANIPPEAPARSSLLAEGKGATRGADGSSEETGDAKTARGTSSDEAESPQQLAQRVARGEVHTAPARSTRKGDADAGGDGKDSMVANGSSVAAPTSLPMGNESALAGARTAGEGPQQAQVAAGMIAPGLSELIEKHVKQLLVSDARGSRSRSREVLLRMQSDILPGTDLWLTRSGEGWQLRADVRSRDAYDTLLANQDELIQRFADRALGALSIDPVFHGEGSAVAGLGPTAITRQR